MRLIDESIAGAIGHPAGPRRLEENLARRPSIQRVLIPMLQALGSSSHTISMLSEKPGLQTRDCFSVSRSVVELAVNICYILASGEEAAERAERHAKQKFFRDLERESTIGGQTIRLKFGGQGKLEMPSDILEMISEFTARSGREMGWTDLSVDARYRLATSSASKSSRRCTGHGLQSIDTLPKSSTAPCLAPFSSWGSPIPPALRLLPPTG